jgi:hypothetical protein
VEDIVTVDNPLGSLLNPYEASDERGGDPQSLAGVPSRASLRLVASAGVSACTVAAVLGTGTAHAGIFDSSFNIGGFSPTSNLLSFNPTFSDPIRPTTSGVIDSSIPKLNANLTPTPIKLPDPAPISTTPIGGADSLKIPPSNSSLSQQVLGQSGTSTPTANTKDAAPATPPPNNGSISIGGTVSPAGSGEVVKVTSPVVDLGPVKAVGTVGATNVGDKVTPSAGLGIVVPSTGNTVLTGDTLNNFGISQPVGNATTLSAGLNPQGQLTVGGFNKDIIPEVVPGVGVGITDNTATGQVSGKVAYAPSGTSLDFNKAATTINQEIGKNVKVSAGTDGSLGFGVKFDLGSGPGGDSGKQVASATGNGLSPEAQQAFNKTAQDFVDGKIGNAANQLGNGLSPEAQQAFNKTAQDFVDGKIGDTANQAGNGLSPEAQQLFSRTVQDFQDGKIGGPAKVGGDDTESNNAPPANNADGVPSGGSEVKDGYSFSKESLPILPPGFEVTPEAISQYQQKILRTFEDVDGSVAPRPLEDIYRTGPGDNLGIAPLPSSIVSDPTNGMFGDGAVTPNATQADPTKLVNSDGATDITVTKAETEDANLQGLRQRGVSEEVMQVFEPENYGSALGQLKNADLKRGIDSYPGPYGSGGSDGPQLNDDSTRADAGTNDGTGDVQSTIDVKSTVAVTPSNITTTVDPGGDSQVTPDPIITPDPITPDPGLIAFASPVFENNLPDVTATTDSFSSFDTSSFAT